MTKSPAPHPVPASGLFGSTWLLSRVRCTPPTPEQFETRYIANDRSAGEDAPERSNSITLVA